MLNPIRHELTNEQYHSHPAISKSHIDIALRSPLHYKAAFIDKIIDRKETPALIEGSLCHSMILEPDKTELEFIVSPEFNKRTNAGKALYQEFLTLHGDKKAVSAEQWEKCQHMRDEVFNHEAAAYWLSDGEPETSWFFTHELSGLECKVRPDWLRRDGVIVDLKTTDDASPKGFVKSVANYSYHVQAAFYMDALKASRFIFVVVEKSAPFAVAVYELDEEAISQGRKMYEQALLTIATCRDSGNWYGFDGLKKLSLPPWAIDREAVKKKVQTF